MNVVKKSSRSCCILAAFAAVLLIFAPLAVIHGAEISRAAPGVAIGAQSQPAPEGGNPIFDLFFSENANSMSTDQTWTERIGAILFRMFLAVLFSAVLAFRPRPDVPLFRRSLFVSQTQILLAVVAAALMMVVGDSAARAFAIFAAASLVRFRTNIRDPKEITVLLISLAIGLASGVGRWELGLALSMFSLALLWLLELKESENIFRPMEVTVKTRNTERTQEILKKIFKRMRLVAEVRKLDPEDEDDPIGAIVYYLNLPLKLSTDKLSDRILAADLDNIEKIVWSKTKSAKDIYK